MDGESGRELEGQNRQGGTAFMCDLRSALDQIGDVPRSAINFVAR